MIRYLSKNKDLLVIDLYDGELIKKVYIVVRGSTIYPLASFYIPGAIPGLSDDDIVLARGIEFYNPYFALRNYNATLKYLLKNYSEMFEIKPVLFSQKKNYITDIYEEIRKVHNLKEFEEFIGGTKPLNLKLIRALSSTNLSIEEAKANIFVSSTTRDYRKIAWEAMEYKFYNDVND